MEEDVQNLSFLRHKHKPSDSAAWINLEKTYWDSLDVTERGFS